ncbi:hypothetical protein [Myroides injenensis]|uniref:hypothetical protein n=1 Tax=Myroides injenensis TaxID=1183151 RepID=UPI000289D0F6|nr:hypothetical protein [Myroides injenensis]
MSAFVISLKENEKFKYTFEHRRGKTIFTSMEYPSKEAIYATINFLKENYELITFLKFKTPSDKLFFKIAIDNNIYGISRKFTTELRYEKGLEEVKKNFISGEILDFSVDIFGDIE